MRRDTIDRTEIRNWVAENPKLLGALWALTLVFAEVAPVVASGGGGSQGP
ncbi:DUF7503 family protein [Halorussus ruber]|nr:hypothetical protein [Halorussus ruber]